MWLSASVDDVTCGLERTILFQAHHDVVGLATDACLTDGGALLLHITGGDPAAAVRNRGAHVLECFSVAWAEADSRATNATIGYAGSQAEWEAYALLLAIKKWATLSRRGRFRLHGDASGVPAAITARRARPGGPS